MKLVRIVLIAFFASTLSPLSFAANNDFSACKIVFANNTPPIISVLDIKLRAYALAVLLSCIQVKVAHLCMSQND